MGCSKGNGCCQTAKCCCKTDGFRYQGPSIPDLGIATGDLIEAVISNLATYLIGGVATSTMTDNGDGSYTHTPGDESGTSTTIFVGRHTTGATPHLTPKQGDTWFDTVAVELKMYTFNGTVYIWKII